MSASSDDSIQPAGSGSRVGAVSLALMMGAVSFILAFSASYAGQQPVGDALWLLVLALVANLATVNWDRSTVDIDTAGGFIPMVIAAVNFGPVIALLTAAVSSLPYLMFGGARMFRCFSTRAFTAVLVSYGFGATALTVTDPDQYLIGVFLAAAGYQLLQLWVTTTLLTVENGSDPKALLTLFGPRFGMALLLFGPMVAAFAAVMPTVPQSVLLASFAAAASHQLLVTVSRSRSFEKLLSELSAEIPGALLAALDAADAYTAQHSASVASYSFDVAQALGFDDRHARQVHAAALLHDVGKIGVPDAVLTKPGKLEEGEWELMKRHPEIGANMVRRLPGFHLLEGGILHHHERMNGTGYPNRISAEQIPVEAQIIAVADTYSAITTTRSYRQARTPEFGISELVKDGAAGKLNADIVTLFVGLLDARDQAYRTGQHTTLAREVSQVRGWLDFAEHGLPGA